MNAQGWGIPNDGVLPDTSLGSYVGDPSAGGLAGEAAAYDHLLLIGPAQAGYFSTPSEMPGAVIEPLYLTDPFEGSIADTTHGQAVIAGGIARAIETFLGTGSCREQRVSRIRFALPACRPSGDPAVRSRAVPRCRPASAPLL